jgi:hypothetical protein
MRLVPNQEWEHITEFTKHFKSIWFSNRKVTSITEVRYDDSIGYKAANMAIRRLLVPLFLFGGSIPIALFEKN